MEKLLELMNEYAHTYADHYDDTGKEIEMKFLEHTDNCFIYYCDGKFDSLVDDVVISKRFGFIKRLIEKDKIDKDKLYNSEYKPYFWNRKTNAFSGFWAENILLMLLAIQNEPINFLISTLK